MSNEFWKMMIIIFGNGFIIFCIWLTIRDANIKMNNEVKNKIYWRD